MNNEPILLVGFDALDMDVVRKAVSSGRMPTFKHLLESWRQAPTEAPPGVYVGAIWPSFSTCLNPGRHGRYCYEQLIPGTYESRRVYSHEIMEAPSFWHALSDAGKRTAIIDVPLQGTPRPINGLQVFQWGAHDPERPFYTHPPEWRENILSREGAYPVEARANATRTRPEEFAGLRDRLLKGIKLKTDLTARVMKEERWDLCVSIFSETHTAGHLLWHLHDTSHPLHSPELSEQVGDAMLDVYSACDRALGELIDKAKNSCRIMAFASHGMEAFYHLTFMLDPILNALETANRHTWQRRGLTAAAAVIRHGGSWVR
ncbi:MAG TPA: alkaline phosphatase family protein, partial [Kiritimatiellia bacterium]|nr:alkaline phosphatase family protein [Kiritimatiellia bacterium]